MTITELQDRRYELLMEEVEIMFPHIVQQLKSGRKFIAIDVKSLEGTHNRDRLRLAGALVCLCANHEASVVFASWHDLLDEGTLAPNT